VEAFYGIRPIQCFSEKYGKSGASHLLGVLSENFRQSFSERCHGRVWYPWRDALRPFLQRRWEKESRRIAGKLLEPETWALNDFILL
jgi:hypothetical protein